VLHTVARGETLSLIARRYGTTWQSLVYWNRERYPSLNPASRSYNPNAIQVGWQLAVWPGVVVAYNPSLPTATPRPTTQPTQKPTAPPPLAASVLISHGSRTSRMVALTFDGGGRAGDSVEIVRWLRDHDVPATIFITGDSATTATGRAVISIINDRPDLFEIGNHSYSHPDMSKQSVAQVVDQLRRAEAAILATSQQSPRPIFRPPYGAWDNDVLRGAGQAGYPLSILWDVDPIDWKAVADGGPTAAQITSNVLSHAQNGSIVLDHLGGWNTLAALPDVVAGLRERGYKLVTLQRLLGY
jgi:peptidoglycan/xylan/chitin deacetylase (PgdA/CDA1 family)